jgi:hypothetical protein
MKAPTVLNMKSAKGNKVPNQFLIWDKDDTVYFQSYQTIIAKRTEEGQVTLDVNKWDYSLTTGRYRNIFLGENKRTTEYNIKRGKYKLENLN